MSEAKHSPTPWAADPDDREGYEWNIHILDQKGDRVCFMTSDGPAEENAALIVEAVNNYESLRAQLAEQDKMLADAADYLNTYSSMEGMDIGAKITRYRLEQQKAAS